MTNLKVLLLTTKKILPLATKVVGNATSSLHIDSEVVNYIKLLSSCNIPFEIKYNNELSHADILSNNSVHYSSVILALPHHELSLTTMELLNKASRNYGLSIIASYNRINRKLSPLFGVSRIYGKRFKLPLSIIMQSEEHYRKTGHQIQLASWRIPIDHFGFRRQPINYITSHIKRFIIQCYSYMKVDLSKHAHVWAVIKGSGAPAIVTYRYGKAINYYIALHSDTFLLRPTYLHKILRHCIMRNSGFGMVSFNLDSTMILRMDDPGTCERVYLNGFDTRLLGEKEWSIIGELLSKYEAKLSVMYVPIWVDDGNLKHGRLFIKGKELKYRGKGVGYNSKDVVFRRNLSNNKELIYDYSQDFHALRDIVQSRLVDVESHGLTHLDTNIDRWLNSKDRYRNVDWFHEFRHVTENRDCSESEQANVLDKGAAKIEEFFGTSPSTVSPSGHQHSNNTDQIAHAHNYKLFSSDYNSICKGGIVIRNDKIPSIFLSQTRANTSKLDSGYPLVGVFHDFDIVNLGIDWLDSQINYWKQCGINKFLTLRELVGYLCSTIKAYHHGNKITSEINISNTGGVSNSCDSRYFSNHQMLVSVTLPMETRPKLVEVDGTQFKDYEYYMENNQITLPLRPFGFKDVQRIEVTFEYVPTKES